MQIDNKPPGCPGNAHGLPSAIFCEDVLVSRISPMGVGGRVRFWCAPRSVEELKEAYRYFQRRSVPVLVVGKMTNVLFLDGRLEQAVIQIKAGSFSEVRQEGASLICGAGADLSQALKEAFLNGLSGLEGLAGIPASCGGACRMNASGRVAISEVIECVKVLDMASGTERFLSPDEMEFGYRSSSLGKDREVILSVRFALKRRPRGEIKEQLRSVVLKKMSSQPLLDKSLGCVFKNPEGDAPPAGELLDRAGLKGRFSGGAEFSSKHANFIINREEASSSDVMALMELGRSKVKNLFGIELENEIRVIHAK